MREEKQVFVHQKTCLVVSLLFWTIDCNKLSSRSETSKLFCFLSNSKYVNSESGTSLLNCDSVPLAISHTVMVISRGVVPTSNSTLVNPLIGFPFLQSSFCLVGTFFSSCSSDIRAVFLFLFAIWNNQKQRHLLKYSILRVHVASFNKNDY